MNERTKEYFVGFHATIDYQLRGLCLAKWNEQNREREFNRECINICKVLIRHKLKNIFLMVVDYLWVDDGDLIAENESFLSCFVNSHFFFYYYNIYYILR